MDLFIARLGRRTLQVRHSFPFFVFDIDDDVERTPVCDSALRKSVVVSKETRFKNEMLTPTLRIRFQHTTKFCASRPQCGSSSDLAFSLGWSAQTAIPQRKQWMPWDRNAHRNAWHCLWGRNACRIFCCYVLSLTVFRANKKSNKTTFM